ncbi:MAG: hypothetical protein MK078_15110 [Crocinitomicaceae bacterium]|nr:hypothetical protein [Crocinitomicaceae bacterium]
MIKFFPLLFSFFLLAFEVNELASNTEIELDKYGNVIQLGRNKENIPSYYWADVFTPVCNTSECLPVKIHIYWDLDGNYWKYEMPGEEILTKTEHEPFTKREYVLLDLIMQDSFSVIKKYTVDYLEEMFHVDSTHVSEDEEVDGITGPTTLMPEGSYIPGALYTSVRLWHLAHDKKKMMASHTKSVLLNSQNPDELISSNSEQGSLYALMKYKKETDLQMFADKLIALDNSLIMRTLPKLSAEEVLDTNIQKAIYTIFKQGDDDIRFEINLIWQMNSCAENTIMDMFSYVQEDPTSFQYLYDLLKNREAWSEDLQHAVIDFLQTDRNLNRKQKIRGLFNAREVEYYKSVKRRVKRERI